MLSSSSSTYDSLTYSYVNSAFDNPVVSLRSNAWLIKPIRLQKAKVENVQGFPRSSKRIGVMMDMIRMNVNRVKLARPIAGDVPISATYVKKLLPIVA